MTTPGQTQVTTEYGSATLPAYPWLPDEDQLATTGQALMCCVVAVLTQWSRIGPYKRQLITMGDTPPWVVKDSQLIVSLSTTHMGRAGEQQFQLTKGAIGKAGYLTTRWWVEVVNPWPSITGGISPRMPSVDAIGTAADGLFRDAWIVFSGLRALMLGGVVTNPPVSPAPDPTSQVFTLVGPLAARGPIGGLAGLRCQVEILL